MNNVSVYDFDGTIYNGHSSIEFFIFCLVRNPKLIKYVPTSIRDLIKIRLKLYKIDKNSIKYCNFVQDVENIDDLIEEFWNSHIHKFKEWYLLQKDKNDIIISASPSFLIGPACEKLGINNYIASDFDKKTGHLNGEICYNGNKRKMFSEVYPKSIVSECYSDSLTEDKPILSLSKNQYLVRGNNIININN